MQPCACRFTCRAAVLDSIRPLSHSSPPLAYRVDGGRITLEFGPADFIQINREINVAMVSAALELLQPTPADKVLDLFCGLGNFTLPLGRRAARVVGVEGDAGAGPQGAGQCRAQRHRKCGFPRGESFRAGSPAGRGRKMPMIWCFSTRRGQARLKSWNAWHSGGRAESCIFPVIQGVWRGTLGSWRGSQGYRLIGAGVMDMFPHTTHVESIAVFERGA